MCRVIHPLLGAFVDGSLRFCELAELIGFDKGMRQVNRLRLDRINLHDLERLVEMLQIFLGLCFLCRIACDIGLKTGINLLERIEADFWRGRSSGRGAFLSFREGPPLILCQATLGR